MLRIIYIIEEITEDGELLQRRFARNKKTADKIVKQIGELAYSRPLNKNEMSFVNPEWVEG